jgi:hypothetical protein
MPCAACRPAPGYGQALADGREDAIALRYVVERDERHVVAESLLHSPCRLECHSRLADASGARQRDEACLRVEQQAFERCELTGPSDKPVHRRGHASRSRHRGSSVALKSFAQQEGEVLRDEPFELGGIGERTIRELGVRLDPFDQRRQPGLAIGRRPLDVDEARLPGREPELVLETGDLHVRRDPSVAFAIDRNEDVTLLEVGAIEVARRVRACPQLEEDGRETQALDRGSNSGTLRGEFLERGAHEHPHALVRSGDHRRLLADIACSRRA